MDKEVQVANSVAMAHAAHTVSMAVKATQSRRHHLPTNKDGGSSSVIADEDKNKMETAHTMARCMGIVLCRIAR